MESCKALKDDIGMYEDVNSLILSVCSDYSMKIQTLQGISLNVPDSSIMLEPSCKCNSSYSDYDATAALCR